MNVKKCEKHGEFFGSYQRCYECAKEKGDLRKPPTYEGELSTAPTDCAWDYEKLFNENYNGVFSRSPKEGYQRGFNLGMDVARAQMTKIITSSTLSVPTQHYLLRLLHPAT